LPVIDAESEYEGKYAAAQTYLTGPPAKIGASYPLGLASFPYVSYHPSFPYSVFLGRAGAVRRAADVLEGHRRLGRHRLCETRTSPTASTGARYSRSADLRRRLGHRNPALPRGGGRLRRPRHLLLGLAGNGHGRLDRADDPLEPLTTSPPTSPTRTRQREKGDQVLWMQEHLASAIPSQVTTGKFESQTAANLEAFQTARGIAASGVTTAPTWEALLALPPSRWCGRERASG